MLLDGRIRSTVRTVVGRRMSLLVTYLSVFLRWLLDSGFFVMRVFAIHNMRWHEKMSKSTDDLNAQGTSQETAY